MTSVTLTKKTMSLLMRDDAAALMALIPSSASARDVELQGEKIAIKCAEAGAMRCLEALLEREPTLARALLAERDGTLARVVDLAAFYADARMARKIIQLAGPSIARDDDPQGDLGALLTRALKGAQWDAALVWLEAAPDLAKTITAYGRSMLHLTAERSFEHESAHPDGPWSPPPKALAERLIALGADPAWLSPRGHSPLSRAIHKGTRSTLEALLDWQARAERPMPLTRESASSPRQSLGVANFSPLHEAVWVDDAQTASRLLDLGADIEERTAQGSTPLRLAVRRGAFACAQALIDRGASLQDFGDPAGPLSLAALHGESPLRWIEWLSERGATLFGRDGMGSSFTEVAWERLSFEHARMVWQMSPPEHRRRDPLSLLGVFERAARASQDPAAKMAFLLGEGLLPARVDSGDEWKHDHPHRFPFGDGSRSAQLGALWLTRQSDPDMPATVPAPTGAYDEDEDDFSISTTPPPGVFQLKAQASEERQRAAGSRPSLLGYLTARGARESLLFLLNWDGQAKHFRDPDYILAWREGLRSDSPMSVMKPLAAALGARSLPLWGEEEAKLAVAHFGPKKAKDLGFSPPSASAFIQEMIETDPKSLHSVFERDGHRLTYLHSARAPWSAAAASSHAGALRACLADEGPWAALACAQVAEALASSPARASTLAWLADSLPARAAKADPSSPWGQNPSQALPLWQSQIEWEYQRALQSHLALNPSDAKKLAPLAPSCGGLSERLLRALVSSDNMPAATRLIEQGLPAPASLGDLLNALGHQVTRHSSINGSPERLREARDLAEALATRPDLRALLPAANAGEDDVERFALSRMPDPVVFETLMNAGAALGKGPKNVFSSLARSFASRLSPAFAQRLADWAQRMSPQEGASLEVAAALAAMRRHHSLFELGDASAAATERALRAAASAAPEDWEAAHRRDCCPIESALAGGNLSIATRLAALAPQSYREEHRAQWASHWLTGRARNLGEALQALPASHWDAPHSGALSARPLPEPPSDASEDPDGSPQADLAARRRRNLERIHSELASLRELGSELGMDPGADTRAALALCEEHSGRGPASSLMWALCNGLKPSMLLEVSDLPYRASHALRGREGRLVPALAAIFDSRDHAMTARAYVEWALRGLPVALQIKQPLEALMGDSSARVEFEPGEPRELMDLMHPAARALAEEALLTRELFNASAAKPEPSAEPAPAPARARRAL